MYDSYSDRMMMAFTPFDWWLIMVLSLIGALIMRKWPQWPAAAFIVFVIDSIAPFFYRLALGIPADFAFDFAMVRLDERGGLVVLIRMAIYFIMIGLIFSAKRRYGQK